MTIRTRDDIAFHPNGALSNTVRNRMAAFGPIAIALVGLGIVALTSDRSGIGVLTADAPSVDPVITGTVAGE